MESIRELFIDEMKDLYDAEKQLVKALPRVVKASENRSLSEAFEKHLEETKGHVERLERAFEMLGAPAKSKSCPAMKGLIEEASQAAQTDGHGALTDSAIICAVQKVEHYEIAGYGTLIAWANALGLDEVADLLNETLEEEKAADGKLTDVGSGILTSAKSLEEDAEEDSGETRTPRKSSAKTGKTPARQAM